MPFRNPKSKIRNGFTLIELLVVVAIIVSLLAILLPSMNKAVRAAVRVQCGSQLRQVCLATFDYASDNFGMLPARPGNATHLPQRVEYAGQYNLNETFIKRYLGERDRIMFCPGDLITARNPKTLGYADLYVTYQYHVYDTDDGWIIEMPNMKQLKQINRPVGLWTCLTVNNTAMGTFLGHDAPDTASAPTGFNSTTTDGAAGWYDWSQRQGYFLNPPGQYYVWPKLP